MIVLFFFTFVMGVFLLGSIFAHEISELFRKEALTSETATLIRSKTRELALQQNCPGSAVWSGGDIILGSAWHVVVPDGAGSYDEASGWALRGSTAKRRARVALTKLKGKL